MAEFLETFGNEAYRSRWQSVYDAIDLTPEQREVLASFRRVMPVLVLAGAWCGDCARQGPIFVRFADVAPVVQVRFLDNRKHADVQAMLRINGGDRVPVVVFFSEDGQEVARYGDRTLSRYRQMARDQLGESCPTGIVAEEDPAKRLEVQDWLDEFERVQWILRLSPRLRRLHGD